MYLNTRHTILLSKSFESSPTTMFHTHNTRFQANNKRFNAAVASQPVPVVLPPPDLESHADSDATHDYYLAGYHCVVKGVMLIKH